MSLLRYNNAMQPTLGQCAPELKLGLLIKGGKDEP